MSTDFNSLREMVKAGVLIPEGEGNFKTPESRVTASSLIYNNALRSSSDVGLFGRDDGILSYDLLRSIAKRSALVKPAVDFIVRSLSTTPYRIRSVEGVRVPKKAIRRAEELFIDPANDMGQGTFRDLLGALLRDVIILDHGIMLKHYKKGGLEAFEAMDAATFMPIADKNGRLDRWQQKLEDSKSRDFSTEEVIGCIMNTRTDSLFGEPALESVVHEINAALNASRSFSSALDKNEIPPGILFLLGVHDNTAIRRFKREVASTAGYQNDYALRVLSGMDDAKWITFQRQFREMQVAELMTTLQRSVWRALGVDRISMGDIEDVNRSTSEAMLMTRNYSLFKPILDMMADKLTYQLLRDIHEGLYIEFVHYSRTGSETDLLIPDFIRPTGFAEDDYDMTTKPAMNETTPAKACGGCDGRRHYQFKVNGEYTTIECPDCGGTGRGGPTFVSRPSGGLLIPEYLNQERIYKMRPREAWNDMSTPGHRDALLNQIELTKNNLLSAYSSVNSVEDLIRVVDRTNRELDKLYDYAYLLSKRIVDKTEYIPTRKAVSAAKSRVYDFIRFQANPRILRVNDAKSASAAAQELVADAVSLCDAATMVAGKTLADL